MQKKKKRSCCWHRSSSLFTLRRVEGHFLRAAGGASVWTTADLTAGRRHHISMHVGSTGCPSLCAALIYPGSGFPENPQISVKHNQPPPLPRRAAGAYSVLLHKSHCNLCCVISGFRCLPLSTEGQAIPQIQHGRKVTGSFYSFFCHMWIFF